MKKKKQQLLNLNKKAISRLNVTHVRGGILSIYWCKTKRPCDGDDTGGDTTGTPGNPDPGDSFTCPSAGCETGINSTCPAC